MLGGIRGCRATDRQSLSFGRPRYLILGNIGIPWDALTPILQVLIAERFKFVLMRGTRFRHRSAKLNSLRLEMRLTEDDAPAG